MKTPPRIGATGEHRFTVEAAHTISFGDQGLPPILSTPSLIWFLEHAAVEAALPTLEPGEITVGTHIEIDHLAPTPLGAAVTCTARVVHCEGAVISYQLEAADAHDTIARGYHKRRVVRAEKLAKRLEQKT